nr:DUF222 domain-containing protein [Gordonia araii]
MGHGALGRPDRLPAELVITVEERDLARRAGVGLTATGAMVPVADLVELAADAAPWLEVFKDHSREILDFGRGKRFATKAQRVALFGRDRGCTRPGCSEPFCRTQAHPVGRVVATKERLYRDHAAADFADGGMTDVADLAGACGPDNRNVGTKPGQWETAIIADGPDQGRIGWRPAGTDLPYRTNPVHHPEKFLRGHPVRGSTTTETGSAAAEPGQEAPDSGAESRPPPKMMRIHPDLFDVGVAGRPCSRIEAAIEEMLGLTA